jgi:sugar diacid utilization regulator
MGSPDDIRAPAAAVEYARRLAQRGVSTIALVRAYRVGHGRFLSRCIEQLASRTTDAALNTAADTVSVELLPTAFENGDAMIRVAVGAPGYGLDGFRQTHVQAERTQDLALAAKPGARVTTFADVGTIALICADVDAARNWVWGTLADLAFDDEPHARLRNTLQVFPDSCPLNRGL